MEPHKDSDIGTNAESEREYGHRRKSRVFPEHSDGVMQILQNTLDEIYASHIPALLLNLREAANGPARGVTRFFQCQTRHQVLCHLLFQVEAQLFLQLRVN